MTPAPTFTPATTPAQPAPAFDISKEIEARVKAELAVMISEFDISGSVSEMSRQTDSTYIDIKQELELNEAMLRKLLVDLGKMLKDPKVVSQIWSDYETVDNEVFSHLHIKFNMEDEKVMIQTAAKDVKGTPIKQAIAPLKPKGPTPPEPVNVQNYQV